MAMTGRPMMEMSKATGNLVRQLLVPIGSWLHPEYGRITVTPERIARMKANFDAGIRTLTNAEGERELPVKRHFSQDNADGWIRKVWPEPDGLHAEIHLTQPGVDAVVGRTKPYISPEILPQFKDPATNQVYADVLDGAGLIPRPFFKELPAVKIVCSDGSPTGLMVFGDPDPKGDTGIEVEDPPVKADADAAPPAKASEQSQQVFADAADIIKRLEAVEASNKALADENAALRGTTREQGIALRRQTFDGELRGLNFGDGQIPARMTPSAIGPLADALADLPPDKAQQILDAVKGIRFCPMGAQGFDDPGDVAGHLTSKDFPLSDLDRKMMREAGLTEEQYRAGMTTRRS